MGRKKQMTASLGRMLIKDTKRKVNNETNVIKSNNIEDTDDDNDVNDCTQQSIDVTKDQNLSKRLSPTTPPLLPTSTTTCVINKDNFDNNTNIVFDHKIIKSNEHIIESKAEFSESFEDYVCDAFDDAFFNPKLSNSHIKGIHGIKSTTNSEQSIGLPPKKHFNRKKREKLRRVYAYLDK